MANALVQKTLPEIQHLITRSALAAKRNPESIRLIAVTKTFGIETIREAYQMGLRDFGENRVQELLEKREQLPADIRWHMIGRLQTNKVKGILGKTALIHSLDRLELFEKMDSEARKQKILRLECLLQVNLSGEAAKAGFAPDQVENFLKQLPRDTPVKIQGLMVMGPLTEDRAEIRHVFHSGKIFFDTLKKNWPQIEWRELSMGMSGDFEIAIEEGTTLIRIGSALFGARA